MSTFKIEKETLSKAFRPFDIVKLKDNSICMIKEVSVNKWQEGFDDQIRYSLVTIYGENNKCAWFDHYELEYIGNFMQIIAEKMCHPFGNNASSVKPLLDSCR